MDLCGPAWNPSGPVWTRATVRGSTRNSGSRHGFHAGSAGSSVASTALLALPISPWLGLPSNILLMLFPSPFLAQPPQYPSALVSIINHTRPRFIADLVFLLRLLGWSQADRPSDVTIAIRASLTSGITERETRCFFHQCQRRAIDLVGCNDHLHSAFGLRLLDDPTYDTPPNALRSVGSPASGNSLILWAFVFTFAHFLPLYIYAWHFITFPALCFPLLV